MVLLHLHRSKMLFVPWVFFKASLSMDDRYGWTQPADIFVMLHHWTLQHWGWSTHCTFGFVLRRYGNCLDFLYILDVLPTRILTNLFLALGWNIHRSTSAHLFWCVWPCCGRMHQKLHDQTRSNRSHPAHPRGLCVRTLRGQQDWHACWHHGCIGRTGQWSHHVEVWAQPQPHEAAKSKWDPPPNVNDNFALRQPQSQPQHQPYCKGHISLTID